MPDVADVTVKAKGDTSDAESKLSNLHEKLKGTAEPAKEGRSGVLGFIGAFAGVEAAAGTFDFLKDQLSESIELGEEGEKTQALLTNAIQATGNASGQTVQGLNDMATHLSSVTTASKETVLGVEQIAVRAKIPPSLFADTTKSAIDMSTAMGVSATAAANTLSKALDNPATAAGALRRAHITLTEEEQKGIKADIARGDTLGAQTIILNAVKGAYGGAAEAVGNTFAGKLQILQNQLENTKEAVGEALIPVLSNLLGIILPVISALAGGLQGAFEHLGEKINDLQPVFQDLGLIFTQISKYTQSLVQMFVVDLAPAFDGLGKGITGVKNPLNDVNATFNAIVPVIAKLFTQGIFPLAEALIGFLVPAIKTAIPIVEQLASTFINKALPIILQVAGFVLTTLVPALGTLAKFIITNVLPIVEQLAVFFVTKVLPVFFQVEGFIVSRLIPVLAGIWEVIQKQILPILATLFQVFQTNVVPALESVWAEVSAKLIPALENLWDKISPILIPALNYVGTILKNFLIPTFQLIGWVLTNVVVPALNGIIDIIGFVINVFATLIGWIVQAVAWFLNWSSQSSDAVANVEGRINTFIGNVINWFEQLPAKIFSAGVDMMTGFINGIKSLAGNVGAALGDVIHGAINSLPGGSQLAHLAGIPGFALGTSYAPGGLAVVGEGSEPELVVGPHLAALPQGSGVYPVSQLPYASGSSNGEGGPIVVNLVLDGQLLTQVVLKNTPMQVWLATGMRAGL